jgi:hypothetical protein
MGAGRVRVPPAESAGRESCGRKEGRKEGSTDATNDGRKEARFAR